MGVEMMVNPPSVPMSPGSSRGRVPFLAREIWECSVLRRQAAASILLLNACPSSRMVNASPRVSTCRSMAEPS